MSPTGRNARSVHPIALDLETTGLDPRHDVILSFGAIPIVDGRVRLDWSTYRVMQSSKPIPTEVVRIHHLRPADLQRAAPRAQALAELEAILGDHPLVVWSAWVETSFLTAAYGGRLRSWRRRMIDVRDLVQEADSRSGRTWDSHETLSTAADRFGIPPGTAHHALADAFVTAQLYLVTQGGPTSPPSWARGLRSHRLRAVPPRRRLD